MSIFKDFAVSCDSTESKVKLFVIGMLGIMCFNVMLLSPSSVNKMEIIGSMSPCLMMISPFVYDLILSTFSAKKEAEVETS